MTYETTPSLDLNFNFSKTSHLWNLQFNSKKKKIDSTDLLAIPLINLQNSNVCDANEKYYEYFFIDINFNIMRFGVGIIIIKHALLL